MDKEKRGIRMDKEIIIALIGAAAVIIASIIGVASWSVSDLSGSA